MAKADLAVLKNVVADESKEKGGTVLLRSVVSGCCVCVALSCSVCAVGCYSIRERRDSTAVDLVSQKDCF